MACTNRGNVNHKPPRSGNMKAKPILCLLSALVLFVGCQQAASTDTPSSTDTSQASESKEGMIKVAILYPNDDGKTFDMDYYANTHMPMVAGLFGDALKGLEIDKGIAGRTPDEPIPYLAVGYFYFEKLSDYENAFGPNAEQILSDIPNYTNIQPVVLISEVVQ